MIKPLVFVVGAFFPQLAAPVAHAAPTPAVLNTRVAAAPTAAEILASVQKFYASINMISANFRQQVVNTTFGRKDDADGKLMVRKPGKMRWEYFAKLRRGKPRSIAKLFISNGSYLYVIDRENKQVIKKDLQLDLLPTAVTFLYGKGDLAADFTPAIDTSGLYGAKTDHVLKLTPKVPSTQYKHLFLVVDTSTFAVRESVLVDSAGNTNHFWFADSDFKTNVKDNYFEFDENGPLVKNYRLVDGTAVRKPAASAAPGSGAVTPKHVH